MAIYMVFQTYDMNQTLKLSLNIHYDKRQTFGIGIPLIPDKIQNLGFGIRDRDGKSNN